MRRHLAELLARVVVLAILIAAFCAPARAGGVCPTSVPAGVSCNFAAGICYVPRSVYRSLSLRDRACGLAALATHGLTYRVVADRR